MSRMGKDELAATAYDHDLQEAIQASLLEQPAAATAGDVSALPDKEILKAFYENEVTTQTSEVALHVLLPHLQEDPVVTESASHTQQIKALESIVSWGRLDTATQAEFLTPIALKNVLSPLPVETSEAYKACLLRLKFAELPPATTQQLLHLVFGHPSTSLLKTGDLLRWLRHPLMFNNASQFAPWGLVQFAGGPCGLLAPLQGYIIMNLFFRNSPPSTPASSKWFTGKAHLRRVMAESIAFSIAQATPPNKPHSLCWINPRPMGSFESYHSLNDLSCVGSVHSYTNDVDEKSELLDSMRILFREFESLSEMTNFIHANLPLLFCSPRIAGCLNLTLSMVLSRGLESLRMEDLEGEQNRSLLGMFGQCNQELVNLMLIGKATSNLFDGDKVLGGDSAPAADESQEVIILRGVPHRSLVGYISEMEAFRYCEVGDLLKFPFYPIWVCGSSDHFTVLFSLNRQTSKLTLTEYAMKIAEEAFRSVAGEEDESGILDVKHLTHLLDVSGFEVSDQLKQHAMRHVVQEGQVILRNDFVRWFDSIREYSDKIKDIDWAEKTRLKQTSESPSSFHLFHYDGQVRVSDQLTVTSGPELRFLKLRLLGTGCDTSRTQLGRILATRWSPPIEVESFATAQVAPVLQRVEEVTRAV
eukprot:Gregarina_sp_Pseudo_9__5598@NODE_762_length_2250_cov_28_685663_g718_i0_p1_GENE_NODE_762_length_2250_cov_28_685663_g718_i0NODE_762_length_2250_cov_28_685663_g718_i0_p1_ORF_typecomplete_len645_score132_27DUF4205/PF13898_6/2_2e60_NODE_762_length_2250_cov_28_685663_g718_i0641998